MAHDQRLKNKIVSAILSYPPDTMSEAEFMADGILAAIGPEMTALSDALSVSCDELNKAYAENKAMREDAEKWRTLLSCERIRIMGRTMDYKHIGIEFWTKHRAAHPSEEFPQDECRAHLEEFVYRAALNKEGE